MFILKFGKEEHLEQLRHGIVHFSPLSKYINDSTLFRGDRLEGKLLINAHEPITINGVDISPYVKEITYSNIGSAGILTFCASILSHNNCHPISENLFVPNDNFIDEMKKFGEYVLVVQYEPFCQSLEQALESKKCSYEYHPIAYCNKDLYDDSARILRSKFANSHYGECFIKDFDLYRIQGEWRFIIDDSDNEFPIEANGGVNIQTNFSTEMPIFCAEDLRTLEISENFLY